MKKSFALVVAGFILGAVFTYFALDVAERLRRRSRITPESAPICYSCFWQGYDSKLHTDLIAFYRQFHTSDPLVAGDVQYILWRSTGNENCKARQFYQRATTDPDGNRRYHARALLGFSAEECGQDGASDLKAASDLASQIGLPSQSALLGQIAAGQANPRFDKVRIQTSLTVPPGSKTMVLGETSVEVPPGTKAGVQVERTARDWLSYQMRWDMTDKPVSVFTLLDYHEGALLKRLLNLTPIEIYPITGTVVARAGEKWIAPDETGVFRFEVLLDKLRYPTSHASGGFAWVVDTHGISLLVPQAVDKKLPLVVGCGDSEGKMEAAFYLAQKGVNVVFPGDRYQDMLLGYQAKGTLIGTAPVKKVGDKVFIGNQPVRFALSETFVAQDTKTPFPLQYYDAPARYFRRLSHLTGINVTYVEVDAPNQVGRVLAKVREIGARAVGIRIATRQEYQALRDWLAQSIQHRAVLFHSGLYPHAQELFELYPEQVTFGDLQPKFLK